MGPKIKLPVLPAESALEEGWRARLPRGYNGEALLSRQLVAAVETLIREGNTRQNAARLCGVRGATISAWVAEGRKDIDGGDNTLAGSLVWAIERSEGEQERKLAFSAWQQATGPIGDGKLALSLLATRNPADWAPAAPETVDAASRFAGQSKQALDAEARRILLASREVDAEVVSPQKK